jgi:hypothetical protein
MYMTPVERAVEAPTVPRIAGLALAVSALIVLYLGILPTRVMEWAAASVSTIF